MNITARRLTRAAALAAALLGAGTAAADSAYGCRGLVKSGLLPAVEGDQGHFYRVDPDLMSDHRLEPEVIAQIAALSRALATRGTTLIYVPVPTKALAMPAQLPPEAGQLGYDPDMAATLYEGTVKALRAAGVRTVDARSALRGTRGGSDPVFRTDPRLTAAGAEALASAAAGVIADLPGYEDLPKTMFRSRMEGTDILPSHIRMMLQESCTATLPLVAAERHSAGPAALAAAVSAAPDARVRGAGIVVVGTEIAGLRPSNFAGFLSAYASLDARQVSAPEDEPFAAISSYLMSDAYAAAPPAVLVWTHPVWTRLADRGDQPMRELIAAAGSTCVMPLDLRVDRNGIGHADLYAVGADPRLTLRLDGGTDAAEATFVFTSRRDGTRIRTIRRTPAQDTFGRIYMPLTALWPEGAEAVAITLDTGFGRNAALTLCNGEG